MTLPSKLAALAAIVLLCAPNLRAADFLIVIDSSGSMSEATTDGQSKMEAAKLALRSLKQDLAAHNVGVTLFGHRVDPNLPGSCEDVENVLPISKFISPEYDRVIEALRPKGNTPLAEALRRSVSSLLSIDKSSNKIVIVVTDGNETCGGDPVGIASQMQKMNINVKLHVIGFGVKPQEQAQLQLLAKAGNGRFGLAKTREDLEKLIRDQIKPVSITVAKQGPRPLNALEKALVARLQDPDRNVRTKAANTLLKMKTVAAADALIERIRIESDVYYAWPAAIQALQGLAPERVESALIAAIASEDSGTSVCAIEVSQQRPVDSTDSKLSALDQALVAALNHKHRNVRSAAAKALQSRKAKAAVPSLAKRVLVDTDGYYAWPAAMNALNALSPDTAMTTAVEAMEAEDAGIRSRATEYATNLVEAN